MIKRRGTRLLVLQLQIRNMSKGDPHRCGLDRALRCMGVGVVEAAAAVLFVDAIHGFL